MACIYCSGGRRLYQNSENTALWISQLGKRYIIEVSCDKCPPFANCSAKDRKAWAAFEIKFCPECGEKLVEDGDKNA